MDASYSPPLATAASARLLMGSAGEARTEGAAIVATADEMLGDGYG